MDLQNQNQSSADYLAPDISELARQRGGQRNDPLNRAKPISTQPTITRSVARRLLPACIAVPAVLWWILYIGHQRGTYDLETCLTLFVYSVAAIFGLIVCLDLKRLSRLDAQRVATEEQLRIAKEAAESANRFKSAFFANISHEIRTPLTAINGFAELLLNPKRTSQQRLEDARVIRRNGEHLLTLINDILDLSKIEAGKMSIERISCNPAALVGEICSMLRHRAAEKGLTLGVNFEGPIPQTIRTDPTRLRQVLINLISNAIKFTKEGGVAITVAIKPAMHEPRPLLEVKISDTGIGIAPDKLESLFQPFVQADATITRQYGGTGLGLTISRHFSRALGGDVEVTSEPGKGSTFTVTVETDPLAGVPIQDNPENALDIRDNFAGPQVRISGSVLVAEDGTDNQALIAARLKQAGLNVELAPNGQVACDKALAAMRANEPFDMILMDVQMPVMDGFTATLNLRSNGYRGPIIALTANAMERDRDKCLNAGCNDFVTKPIQLEKLFKAMGRYLKVEQASEQTTPQADPGSLLARLNDFYQKLPEELAEIDQAIERQDKQRLLELLQLILGNAMNLELKDLAEQATTVCETVENESSWKAIRQVVGEFTRGLQPKTERKAA